MNLQRINLMKDARKIIKQTAVLTPTTYLLLSVLLSMDWMTIFDNSVLLKTSLRGGGTLIALVISLAIGERMIK